MGFVIALTLTALLGVLWALAKATDQSDQATEPPVDEAAPENWSWPERGSHGSR